MLISNSLPGKICKIVRNPIKDSRGYFLKVIDGNEAGNPYTCEVYITSAKPGESKGGHYHVKAQEWFTLIKGEALLTIINVDTLEKSEIRLIETKPETIFIPPGIAHSFKNVGNGDFILLAYADIKYQPEDTIIFNF